MTPRHSYTETNESSIIELIEKFPGLGLRELARELKTSPQSLKYYTDKLVADEDIIVKKDGKYSRFYGKNFQVEEYEQNILNCLRKEPLYKTVLVFLKTQHKHNKKTLKNSELMAELKVQSAGTVTYYLNQLIESKIIEKNKDGFNLINPSIIEFFIKKYSPAPSIIDNFINLWSDYFQ